MKQLKDNVICKYCLGCNRLLLEDFDGVKNCKGFAAGYKDWQERFYKALKGERNAKVAKKKKRN